MFPLRSKLEERPLSPKYTEGDRSLSARRGLKLSKESAVAELLRTLKDLRRECSLYFV
jgi:hypothetical protein